MSGASSPGRIAMRWSSRTRRSAFLRPWLVAVSIGIASIATLASTGVAEAQPTNDRNQHEAEALERDAASRIAAGAWANAASTLEKAISLRERAGRTSESIAPLLLVLEYVETQAGAKDRADRARARFDRDFEIKVFPPAKDPTRPRVEKRLFAIQAALKPFASQLDAERAFAAADPLYLKDLALQELHYGETQAVGAEYSRVGERFRQQKGDLVNAGKLLERANSIFVKLGANDDSAAYAANALGCLYIDTRDYDRAEKVFERARDIWAKVAPNNLAVAFNNLAIVQQNRGEIEKAQEMYEKALAMWEKQLGPLSENVAISSMNLGTIARRNEEYTLAEQRFSRSLDIREQTKPKDAAMPAIGLANTFAELGQRARAEEMFSLALERGIQKGGENHLDVARTLDDRGDFYWDLGELDRAESDLRRALAIREKTTGEGSVAVASLQSSLGRLLLARGAIDEAETRLKAALALQEKIEGPDHPEVADQHLFLANLYWVKNDFQNATKSYHRVLEIRRAALGDDSPLTLSPLSQIAFVRWSSGDLDGAIEALASVARSTEPMLGTLLAVSTEARRGRFITSFENRLSIALSLHAAARSDRSARFALLSSIRTKHRPFDMLVDQVAPWRRAVSSQEQSSWIERGKLRAKQGRDLLDGSLRALPASYRERYTKRASDIAAIESTLPQERRELGAAIGDDAVDSLLATLGDSALVDYVRFDPFDPSKKTRPEQIQPARYVAIVARSSGVTVVDLGEAKPIDELVLKHHSALSTASGADPKTLGRQLDEKIFQPLQAALKGAPSIVISPDGSLGEVAFQALVDEQQRWRIEGVPIRYVSSARTLLRKRSSRESAPEIDALVVTQPKLDLGAGGAGFKSRELMPPGVVLATKFAPFRASIDPPPFTLLDGAKVLAGPDASEVDLKRAPSSKLVYLDAPGYALPDEPKDTVRLRTFESPPGTMGNTTLLPRSVKRQNPAFSSGLALSGANLGQSADDAGLLGAIEIAGLSWKQTELVVIPRFDASPRDPQRSAGVAVGSLREAVSIAGARTLVHSLWVAPDTSVQPIVGDMVRSLASGKSRAEALRSAQLHLMANPATAHPHHWASLTLVGDDGPLPIKLAASAMPAAKTPTPHACGCEVPGATSHGVTPVLGALALSSIAALRRRRIRSE